MFDISYVYLTLSIIFFTMRIYVSLVMYMYTLSSSFSLLGQARTSLEYVSPAIRWIWMTIQMNSFLMPDDHLRSVVKASLVIWDKVTWWSYMPEERNLCEHSWNATWASSGRACKVLSSRKCGKCGWLKTGCWTLHHWRQADGCFGKGCLLLV